jgi:hypothetical protein
MSRPTAVKQIRQYHGAVINANKTIDVAGREQIRAAYKCGQLLEKERGSVRSGQWGKFCKRCGMSEDTAGRYIKLSLSADLRDLIQNYRTLNAAYVGEEITPAPRRRITVKEVSPAPPGSGTNPPVQNTGGDGSSASPDGKGDDEHENPEKKPSDFVRAKRYANKLCLLLETTKDKQAMIHAIQHLIDEISEYVRLKAEQEKRTAEDAEFDKATLAA